MNIKTLVKLALKEDVAKGDITTNSLIKNNKIISADFFAKEAGIVCGLDITKMVFQLLDNKIIFNKIVKDGQKVKNSQVIAQIKGNVKTILTGERTALNFLQHLSGIATLTNKFVKSAGKKTKIYDTRKTTPLLREVEKYAVRCGGGYNHRLNLSDMVLIKDNHLELVKNFDLDIKSFPKNKKIEIEAQNYEHVKQFVILNPDIIMLDNMDYVEMRKSIKYIRKHSDCEIEISGNVSAKTIEELASLKPDRISVGIITHSAPSIDISLEF